MTRALTPELVEQRLSELQELAKLGESLLEAELPLIERKILEHRSLRIEARVSGACSPDARDLQLFASAPAIDRHLGWIADTWLDPDHGAILATGFVVLVACSVDGRPVDAVPRGCDALVTLRFLRGIPPALDALCVLERPDHRVRLWLCVGRDRARALW